MTGQELRDRLLGKQMVAYRSRKTERVREQRIDDFGEIVDISSESESVYKFTFAGGVYYRFDESVCRQLSEKKRCKCAYTNEKGLDGVVILKIKEK